MTLVLGTAGHIDHGKSTLVQALTGIDPDRLKEEKARGITIELGFAHTRIGELDVAFVDVPGHERFVRTMLAGVGGVDCVLLVVAADESVMPQTREHFEICRLLQVPRGILVLTKIDAADPDTAEIAAMEARELVAGSPLADAPLVRVSARTGAGLDALRAAIDAEASHVAPRATRGAVRLPIDRVFSMPGFGPVVTGTLGSGRLRLEHELVLTPGERPVRVRGIQVHGRTQPAAEAGNRAAVNLNGVELAQIARGQTLAEPGTLTVTRATEASIELLPDAKPLRQGARVRLHQGTTAVLARISIVGSASTIEPGRPAPVRVRLESSAALTRGDRFILRAYSPATTIGGGVVLDPKPQTARVRSDVAVARLRRLAWPAVNDTDAVLSMLDDAGAAGLPLRELVSRAGVQPDAVEALVTAMVDRGVAVQTRHRLVSAAALADARTRMLHAVETYHRLHPLEAGLPREEVRTRVLPGADADVVEAAIAQLVTEGRVTATDRLASTRHQLALTPEEQRARTQLDQRLRACGLAPPDVAVVAADAAIALPVADRMAALLVRQRVLTRLGPLLFHSEALAQLQSKVVEMKGGADGQAAIDVATFKERFGVSRKFAIPLLEWLDRERVTRRVGEKRVIL